MTEWGAEDPRVTEELRPAQGRGLDWYRVPSLGAEDRAGCPSQFARVLGCFSGGFFRSEVVATWEGACHHLAARTGHIGLIKQSLQAAVCSGRLRFCRCLPGLESWLLSFLSGNFEDTNYPSCVPHFPLPQKGTNNCTHLKGCHGIE